MVNVDLFEDLLGASWVDHEDLLGFSMASGFTKIGTDSTGRRRFKEVLYAGAPGWACVIG